MSALEFYNHLSRRRLLVLSAAWGMLAASPVTASAQVELNFWDMQWGGVNYPKIAQKLVDQFNASQSDIKIKYRSVAWTGWYETYVTAIASGSAPDLSTGAGFQAVQFYSQDEILPVDDLVEGMKADGTIKDFSPATLESMRYEGHYVSLPWAIDTRVVFYRKDLLDAKGVNPPTSWDELRAAAKALTTSGKFGLVSSGDSGGMHWIPAALINNGSGLFDADGKANVTSERSMEALNFLAALVADGSVNPASTGYVNDDARGSFFRGDAAFFMSSPNLAASAPADIQDKIGVLPPLKGQHGTQGTISWVNNIMAYHQTQHPKETLRFMKWWSEHQLPLWTEGGAGGVPARLSYQNDAYFQSNANIKFAIENYLPVAKPMSAIKGGTFPALNEVDGDGFLNSLIQKIWQGQSPTDVAPPVQAHLEEILGQ